MRTRIVFRDADFRFLGDHVLGGSNEEAAICLGGWVRTENLLAILVREVHPVSSEAVLRQHGTVVEIDPVWLAARIKEARRHRLAVVVIHSHPFSTTGVAFSGTDLTGQAQLIPRLQRRVAGIPHAEMVFGRQSVDALIWPAGYLEPHRVETVRIIGEALEDISTTGGATAPHRRVLAQHHRQVLFLGEDGQRRLGQLRIGVVGVGGNGSALAVSLLHLGVGALVAVDPDLVDESNRNRVLDAGPEDDGITPKVELVRRYSRRIGSPTAVVPIQAPVEEAWAKLRDCDVIFGCTDNVASRFVLSRLAAQYFIPLIDTGMDIEVVEGRLRTIAGRVTVVRPGGACVEALGFTSEEAARAEVQNQRRPSYVAGEPAASALPANLLVAGKAGLEFLKLVHGLLGGSRSDRYWFYSARSGELRGCEASAALPCACDRLAGLGDTGPAPTLPHREEGEATTA